MDQEIEKEVIKSSIPIFLPFILKKLANVMKTQEQDKDAVSEAIGRHLTEVVNWATRIQFFGMSVPHTTEKDTIPLGMYTEARRFQGQANPAKIVGEHDLLMGANNVLLLGEPGSGKTTTLKRLALALLKEPPKSESDNLQYPVVIRLKELDEDESLIWKIAEILGFEPKVVTVFIPRQYYDAKGKPYTEQTPIYIPKIGSEKIEDAVPRILNESNTLLLLDGLDELRSEFRTKVRGEIVDLGRRLTKSKIIVSCRSGDYTSQMDGFSVYEICPLDKKQIISIKDKWLGTKDKKFVEGLDKSPYSDVADRPLLLCQLLFIYQRYGDFPDQPCNIYDRLLNLVLQEWDAQREIKRQSKYAGFDTKRKTDFLAAISYQLTYLLEKTRFTENDLIKAYLSIYERFELPRDEARQVAREIQTHTGIIVAAPMDAYEFSHLSLQEYLCAYYLVRLSIDNIQTDYLIKRSAPLGVAIALASNPSQWFASLILSYGNIKYFDEDSMSSLLSRIMVEHPVFEASAPLGFTIIALFKRFEKSERVYSYLIQLTDIKGGIGAIDSALRWYVPRIPQLKNSKFFGVSLKQPVEKVYKFDLPSDGCVPKDLLPKLNAVADWKARKLFVI